MNEIIGLKLVSGEEIIARVVSRLGDGKILIEKPMALQMIPKQTSGYGIGLVPFVFLTQYAIELNESAIAAEYSPDVEFEKEYLTQVSGIMLQ